MPTAPASDARTTADRRPSRRSVVRGAGWAASVALVATAAPAIAASSPCASTFVTSQGGAADGRTATMRTTVGGKTYTVRITSVLAPNTTTTPCQESPAYGGAPQGTNMRFTSKGIDGGRPAAGTGDRVWDWTGGATLVLNQVGASSPCASRPGGIPRQTLTHLLLHRPDRCGDHAEELRDRGGGHLLEQQEQPRREEG